MVREDARRQPPPPDVSLAFKPSGGERFADLLDGIEAGLVDHKSPNLVGPRLRLEREISKKLPDEIDVALTFEMNDLCQRLLPSADSELTRVKFLSKLQRILDTEWPDKQIVVHVFGSSKNGLGTLSSDVDICLTTPWDDRVNGVANILVLATALQKHGMEGVSSVAKAKVPICKFYDPEYHLSCDVNVNNTIALRNTRLIKTYVELDPRVKPLMLVIKHWTRRRALNDAAKGGTLSTYCWTMMVINFLQMRNPPILPCLHEMYFDQLKRDPHTVKPVIVDGVDCSFFEAVEELKGFGERNTETLAALLFGFFRRYAVEFDYSNHVISVRHGCYMTKEEKGWNVDIERMCRFLCVEEPFNPQRNLANSADAVSVTGLRREFDRALSALLQGLGLEAACDLYLPSRSRPPHSATSRNGNFGQGHNNNHRNRSPDKGWRKRESYGQHGPSPDHHHHRMNNYGYKSMPLHNNYHYPKAPQQYMHSGPSSDQPTELDRRAMARLSLMRPGGPYITQEDINRLSSLHLESRYLENSHRTRSVYHTYASDRRLGGDPKRRGVNHIWGNNYQSPRDRDRSAANAGHKSPSVMSTTSAESSATPDEAGKDKAVSDTSQVSTSSDVSKVHASSPDQITDTPARRSPIQVIIEKQQDGEPIKEVIVSEIGSDGQTLSCERSFSVAKHVTADKKTPQKTASGGGRSPPAVTQRSTQNFSLSDIKFGTASLDFSELPSPSDEDCTSPTPTSSAPQRGLPVWGPAAAAAPSSSSTSTSPVKKTYAQGVINGVQHTKSSAKADSSEIVFGDISGPRVSRYDFMADPSIRKASPTKSDAGGYREWNRGNKTHTRRLSEELHQPHREDQRDHRDRTYSDQARRVVGHDESSTLSSPGSLADSSASAKRRGSKGILLWANRSHRVDTPPPTVAVPTRKSSSTSTVTSPTEVDDPSTQQLGGKGLSPPSNRRARESRSRDRKAKETKHRAWGHRPRSLSASAPTTKNDWRDPRVKSSQHSSNPPPHHTQATQTYTTSTKETATGTAVVGDTNTPQTRQCHTQTQTSPSFRPVVQHVDCGTDMESLNTPSSSKTSQGQPPVNRGWKTSSSQHGNRTSSIAPAEA